MNSWGLFGPLSGLGLKCVGHTASVVPWLTVPGMADATITAVHLTHWEVRAFGVDLTVRDVRELDCSEDWLVFNQHGQSLPVRDPAAAAAIAAVLASAS